MDDLFKEIYNLNNIDLHFDKKFQFSNYKFNVNVIDLDNNLFDNKEWLLNDFKLLEENLNRVKSKLNNYDLRKWSYSTNRFGLCNIYNCYNDYQYYDDLNDYQKERPELFTRAWIKLYEILIKFNFKEILNENLSNYDNQMNCLFLCEAPGAFVTSINHFIKQNLSTNRNIKFNWLATSLNPYYENNNQYKDALIEDCFIESTFDNWYFGEDNSGDIQQPGFYQLLKNEFKNLLNRSQDNKPKINSFKINLITADGGISNIEKPDLQEINSFNLILHELIVALNCLADGGCFILKIFTFFNCRTISMIYLLVCLFKILNLYKPISSKEGNSEIYLIGIDYQFKNNNQTSLINTILFKKDIIPLTFLEQLNECSNFFTDHQINAINRNIYLFDKNDKRFYFNYKKLQKKLDEKFKKLVNLKPIKIDDQIVKKSNQICFSKEYYYFGLNRKMIIDYHSLTTFTDLINELNNSDKKLIKIKKLINSIFSKSEDKFYNYLNTFHTFKHNNSSIVFNLDKFIIVDLKKFQLNNNSSYLNSKFCLEDLIKVLVDYKSLNYVNSIIGLNEIIENNRNSVKNQLTKLLKSKLNEMNKFNKIPLSFYLNNIQLKNQAKESDLSIIILESINNLDINLTKSKSINNQKSNNLIINLIDLCNLNEKKDNEYYLTNLLILELIKIIDQFQYDHLLIISLPSLLTRYLNSLIYLLTSMFNQFTIIPTYLWTDNKQNFQNGLVLLFTNKTPNNYEINFNDQHNKVKNLLENINDFNLINKDKQILDFIGIHNLKKHNKDYLRLIITANNLNLIEKIKIEIENSK